jgi:hypothetical protein
VKTKSISNRDGKDNTYFRNVSVVNNVITNDEQSGSLAQINEQGES